MGMVVLVVGGLTMASFHLRRSPHLPNDDSRATITWSHIETTQLGKDCC